MFIRYFQHWVWYVVALAVSPVASAMELSSSVVGQGNQADADHAQHAVINGEMHNQGPSVRGGQSDPEQLNWVADIRVHSAKELEKVLIRVDSLFAQGDFASGTQSPVIFLLHGNEAKTLFKSNYKQHKPVVDLAAKLSAFGVVDIKVCETWAGHRGLDKSNLQPFVGTVPFAPAEEERLLEEHGYTYF